MNEDERTSLERAIAEWQGPIYNLAYRMLGNEADAADAAQEVFLAIVRQWGRYDRARPLKPWLFKVALNSIRNFHRGAAARARREAEASRKAEASREGDPVEDDDLKRRVHDALARLPAHDRTLIVLHYYSGLSQVEMGAALSLSRTTLQSRLGKALERLRAALTGLGCAVPVSMIEAAMRGTSPLEVPAALADALSVLPAAGGGAVAGTVLPMTLGGMVMAKKTLVVSALLAGFLAFSSGVYLTGKQRGKMEMERIAAAEAESAAASRQEGEALRAKYDEVTLELQTLHNRLMEQTSTAEGERELPSKAGTKEDDKDGTAALADGDVQLDWSKLSALFAERLDLIYELSEEGKDRQPTKEERRLMAEFGSVLDEILSKVRMISDDPFYDKRVLLGLCDAMYSPALGLSAEKDKAVRAAMAKVFAETVEGFDPDAALPAETYRVRQSFLNGLDDVMGSSIDETQTERWQKISALTRKFLEGDRDCVSIPSAPEGGAEAREAALIREWDRAFSLAEGQGALIQPLAADFLNRADGLRSNYGQLDASPRELGPLEKAKFQAEMLDLQIQAETQILRHLTPEQREALRGRAPLIFLFAPGNESWTDRRRGGPL